MTAAPAPEPRTLRWRGVLAALIAFGVLSSVPVFGLHAPVGDWQVLLVTLLATCAVVGWLRGGSLLAAVVWLVAAGFVLFRAGIVAADSYSWLERGWILLLAGIFGVGAVLATGQRFFVRALFTVTAAFAVALVVLSAKSGSFERVQVIAGGEFVTRNETWIETLETRTDGLVRSSGDANLGGQMEAYKEKMRSAPIASQILAPALLALQSIAALALAWAMYHRLNRVRIGPRLAPLREFRFNDQLVWGLAVGLVILLLPAFAEAQAVGVNLVVFFAMLYFVRGLAVLAWVTKGGMFVGLAALMTVLWPVCGALGLSDTWLDWRSRAKAA